MSIATLNTPLSMSPSHTPAPLLLTLAGHDPTGGAGLTTDLAAWQAMGCRGASVCTALTVQNAEGVQQVLPIAVPVLHAALAALMAEAQPAAVKVGMLGDADVAAEVASFCAAFTDGPVVWDPVLAASAGGVPLLQAGAGALAAMARAATVITPNRVEAAQLLGVPAWSDGGAMPPDWLAAMRAQWLAGQGRTQAVVLKGGHAQGAQSVDWLVTRDGAQAFAVPRLAHGAHGTGCLYAAVLAAMLAQGWSVADAAVEAQWRTHAGIAQAWRAEPEARPLVNPAAMLNSGSFPRRLASGRLSQAEVPAFAPLTAPPSFYPILPDADWALRVLDWGARTLQLRIKHLQGAALRADIARVAEAARQAGAQLFVNDHWREALDAGAYGVHLGQEDLQVADLAALRAAGVRLGVSTHTPGEMARAHALAPSYIALGPVYPTTLKVMPYRPLGLPRLADWAARCHPRYPTVAIGGISLERAPGVMAAGADGYAVVSAVTQAADPRAAVRQGLAIAQQALDCRAAAAA